MQVMVVVTLITLSSPHYAYASMYLALTCHLIRLRPLFPPLSQRFQFTLAQIAIAELCLHVSSRLVLLNLTRIHSGPHHRITDPLLATLWFATAS
ncbi:hypothetical protein BJV78DRAFT_1253478 [Lactifluus subvellereus]|nr:hypothetical protein BJV78DRAFT_1253478 [Lactifluus subvellereus]